MKKVTLILFLFCANVLNAQQLYLGGSYEFSIDNFRQVPNNGALVDLNWGLCTQYTFTEKSPFGYEGDLLCDLFGPNQETSFGIPAPCFTAINYIILNPFYPFPYMYLQLKGGFFYSHYFTQYIEPRNDYGPAASIDLLFKISKKAYWGFEVSKLFGLSKYYVWVDEPLGIYYADPSFVNPSGYSNITYTSFSLKFVYKIDNLHGK